MTATTDCSDGLKPGTSQTRIQQERRALILGSALEVFSVHGFRGATLDQIADRSGMSKPNLLYYFPNKDALYLAVLEDTLAEWLEPLAALDPDGEPAAEIGRYITAKVEMARINPAASRLFAMEIISGAPIIGEFLHGELRELVQTKSAVIRAWIENGRLAPIDPPHLIFMIWAVTQHYADFDTQIRAVLGQDESRDDSQHFALAHDNITRIMLKGLLP